MSAIHQVKLSVFTVAAVIAVLAPFCAHAEEAESIVFELPEVVIEVVETPAATPEPIPPPIEKPVPAPAPLPTPEPTVAPSPTPEPTPSPIPVPVIDFSAPWLGDKSELSKEAFDRLVKFAEADALVKPVLDRALVRIGATHVDELFKFVRVCDEKTLGGVKGKVLFNNMTGDATGIYALAIQEDDMLSGTSTEQALKSDIDSIVSKLVYKYAHVVYAVDYATVSVRLADDIAICLANDLNLGQAYELFVHEVTHFADIEFNADDILAYRDEADYVLQVQLRRGEEVDAYIAGCTARIRLEQNRENICYSLHSFFNDAGEFTGSREAASRMILDPIIGYGYLDKRENEYVSRLKSSRRLEAKTRETLASWLSVAKKNAGVYQKTAKKLASAVKSYEKRLRKAQKDGHLKTQASLRKKYEPKKEKYERSLKLSKAYAATAARLAADLKIRDARLVEFRRRLEGQ